MAYEWWVWLMSGGVAYKWWVGLIGGVVNVAYVSGRGLCKWVVW